MVHLILKNHHLKILKILYLFQDTYTNDSNFAEDLAMWTVQFQIPHIALKALLQKLKKHSCFSTLPADARTLLQTPQKQQVHTVTPENYYHFSLRKFILKILASVKENIECLKMTINVPFSNS